MSDSVARLDRAKEVQVEVTTAKGRKIGVPIWVVVIDGVPYIASVKGEGGQWYRALRASGKGALVAGRTRIPVKVKHVDTPSLRKAVSDAYAAKYPASRASVRAMQRPEVLATILRVEV
ncbi:MAG TPA: DUF2255 family protein [Candidatus Limnocylindria bacterium]|nr:DUF2255 family protein [Candidatus Limnocylindria bacterium]